MADPQTPREQIEEAIKSARAKAFLFPWELEILSRCAEALLKEHKVYGAQSNTPDCEGCFAAGPCPVLSKIVEGK